MCENPGNNTYITQSKGNHHQRVYMDHQNFGLMEICVCPTGPHEKFWRSPPVPTKNFGGPHRSPRKKLAVHTGPHTIDLAGHTKRKSDVHGNAYLYLSRSSLRYKLQMHGVAGSTNIWPNGKPEPIAITAMQCKK